MILVAASTYRQHLLIEALSETQKLPCLHRAIQSSGRR